MQATLNKLSEPPLACILGIIMVWCSLALGHTIVVLQTQTTGGFSIVDSMLSLACGIAGFLCVWFGMKQPENQGTVLGYRIEQLAEIRDLCPAGDRLGVCIDTCHAFAAGYDLTAPNGVEVFLDQFAALFGLDGLGCMHLNDSRHPLGSRKDRHANIGAGELGPDAFASIMASPRLREVPLIIETPIGDDGLGHARDLDLLRSFDARGPADAAS